MFQSVGVDAMWDMAYGRQPNSGESGYGWFVGLAYEPT
ncbi:hypothetical protein RISK_004897 [Rhodopirellula islandica]|uniref:Uncharacterized protein n=1 Tax=Rhodopirellula islandica TaxID=595434 RepID=A0A0J1B9H1_RHOIS|nr:hypothetical protein RISK_004897 [Rhodopirellula islandica]